MFVKSSFIKIKTRGLFYKLFNVLENNNNANFYRNGEKVFIDNLLKIFGNQETKERVIFDIGANVGNYSDMIIKNVDVLKLGTKLYLFEPVSKSFEILSQKFGEKQNVMLNNCAASNIDGEASIFFDNEKSEFASLYQRKLDFYDIKLNKSEKIKLIRLDNYIKEKGICHIDFMKIDVEGHELKVFEGLGKFLDGNFIDYIQFEYGGANLDSHSNLMDFYSILESKGFRIAKIMPGGLEIRRYHPRMENFKVQDNLTSELYQLSC